MLKDIAGIRFRGANFETLTDILFLNPHENNSSRAGRKTLVHLTAGKFPATLFVRNNYMKELSVFCDENGDFGEI